MAASPEASTEVTDQRRSSHVAALSPDQCAAYAPVPGKLDLRMSRPSFSKLWKLSFR